MLSQTFRLPVCKTSQLLKTLTLAAIIAPFWVVGAQAWTGDDVTQRLQAYLKEQMVELTFSGAETDGSNMLLHDVKAKLLIDEKDNESNDTDITDGDDNTESVLNLGNVRLEGITENASGAYVIENVIFDDNKIVEEKSVITTAGARIEKLKLPKDPQSDLLGRMEYLEGFRLDTLSVAAGGTAVFSLNGFYITKEPYSKEKASKFTWGFKALDIDLEEADKISKKRKEQEAAESATSIAKAEKTEQDQADIDGTTADDTKIAQNDAGEDAIEAIAADVDDDIDMDAVRALGLGKIHLSADSQGSWSPYSGQYIINYMTINGQNIGSYNYKLHMGGYDMKFIKAVADLYANILKDGAESTSMQVAAMGIIQQLSITNMEMRYDDASFADKLINYQAQKQSKTRAELVDEIKAQLQAGVLYFDNAPLVQQAAKAVGEFLDHPKSITIKIQPEQPVSFAILAAVGMAEPKKLWSVLNVIVEAN